MPQKPRVLFVCTHNSARSQMAEGLLRAMAGDRFEAASAGTQASRVHPLAVAAMADIGIDISRQASKTLDAVLDQHWDYVITVCDRAAESCPVFPAPARRLAWSFEDPTAATGGEEARLAVFRKVREEIRARIRLFLAATAGSRSGEGPAG